MVSKETTDRIFDTLHNGDYVNIVVAVSMDQDFIAEEIAKETISEGLKGHWIEDQKIYQKLMSKLVPKPEVSA